jgi:hypothetical protein
MADPDALRAEFIGLHNGYLKVHSEMMALQEKAIHGMRIVGTGCVNEKDEQIFSDCKIKMDEILDRMKEICKLLLVHHAR